jgi:hypothetical protein
MMKRFRHKQLVAIMMTAVMMMTGSGMAMAKSANAGNGNAAKRATEDVVRPAEAAGVSQGKAVGKTRNDAKAKALNDLKLFHGVSTTSFVPDLARGATRIEAITLIGRALKWTEEADFGTSSVGLPKDVLDYLAAAPNDASRVEMAEYVRYALAQGVTVGIDESRFGVGMPVNARMVFTWYARALLYEEDVWNHPELLVNLGMLSEADLAEMNWEKHANRDDLVGIMYDAMNWKIRGTNMKLLQRMIKNMWIDYRAAIKAGLLDPREEGLAYVVRQSYRDQLKLTFSHSLNEAAAEASENYVIHVRHRPVGIVEPQTISGGAIVVTGGAITVEGETVDPEDYSGTLSDDGKSVVLQFNDDFWVGDRVYVTPTQAVVSREEGYKLDEKHDTRFIVIR